MTRSHLNRVFAALVAVMLCASAPVAGRILVPTSRTGVTVRLIDGWELSDMTVRWSEDDAALLVVRPDGARRLFAPAELAGLLDAAGRDITGEILPIATTPRPVADVPPAAVPPPPPEPARPVGDDWRFVFGLEAGYCKPLDGGFAGADGGLGFGARARLQIVGPVYLAAGYTWQSLGDRVWDTCEAAPIEDGFTDIRYDRGVDEARLTGVWAGLALIGGNRDHEAARFYLECGVGRFEITGLPVWYGDDTSAGYHAGAGLLIPIGPAGVLDFGARGTRVTDLRLGYVGDDEHTLVGFHVGIDLLGR